MGKGRLARRGVTDNEPDEEAAANKPDEISNREEEEEPAIVLTLANNLGTTVTLDDEKAGDACPPDDTWALPTETDEELTDDRAMFLIGGTVPTDELDAEGVG